MKEEGFTLYAVDGGQSRVSVVPDWTVLPDPANALARVLERDFNPGETAVVEQDPGIEPTAGEWPGTSTYSEVTPEDVRISVSADAPSLVVVRNTWEEGWSATVDGVPAPVLRANWFMQAVPVDAGQHEVRLRYKEPAIAQGIAMSAVVWGGWLIALVLSSIASRRRRRRELPD